MGDATRIFLTHTPDMRASAGFVPAVTELVLGFLVDLWTTRPSRA